MTGLRGKSAHTPGPWRFVNEPNNRLVVSESCSTDDGDAMLVLDLEHGAYDYSDYGFSLDANACLIAAAPDLLEVVKEIVASNRDGTWETDKEWFVEKARAALAKATEVSP